MSFASKTLLRCDYTPAVLQERSAVSSDHPITTPSAATATVARSIKSNLQVCSNCADVCFRILLQLHTSPNIAAHNNLEKRTRCP